MHLCDGLASIQTNLAIADTVVLCFCRRVEAAEDGSLSQGEIFSNEGAVSDSDHPPKGPWAPSDARDAQRINGKSVTR